MPADRRWSDADRELVLRVLADCTVSTVQLPEAVLDALTAAGWEPRCDCDGVAHDLPILRAHIRGEPGCMAARAATKGASMAEPFTPAELEAGAGAVAALYRHTKPERHDREIAAAVLRAVLPDHDARVRADERARVARQIADWAGYGYSTDWEQGYRAAIHAAAIARAHATTPTTEETA